MKKRLITKLMVLGMGAALFGGGCSGGSLQQNIWKGFGYSLGGIPADFVVNFLTDLLGTPVATPA